MSDAGKSRAIVVGNNERYRVRSVDRALELLELLADGGADGLPLVSLARGIGTSKSTALALLHTLAARGFVTQIGEGKGKRYGLGLTLARLGDQVLSQIDLLDLALPALRKMTDETGWTSRIGVLDEGYAVIVGRVDGPGIVRFQSNLARRELPHCSAIGKALLAHLPDERVRAIAQVKGLPARTPRTIRDVDALLAELDAVRASGFAVDDEEDNEGIVCVGSSVYDHHGTCVGAISVTGLKPTLPDGGTDTLGSVVRRYAGEISARLGAVEIPVP